MSVRPKAWATLLACTTVLVACGSRAIGDSINGAADNRNAGAGAFAGDPVSGGDWMRFNYDAQRSGIGPAVTGITSHNLGSLRLRRVHLNGTVDSSAIELHAISVHGRTRDIVVVTTTYGRTIALDPGTGARLWEYTPSDIGAYEGTFQITTATPIADPNRRYVYAATPDGRIRKLVLATGDEVRSAHWPARITFDATREKIPAALNITGHSVVATTGGYVGDASYYQGHVVVIDRATGRVQHVWNSLCSHRHYLIDPPSSCPYPGNGGSAIWSRAGAVIEPRSGRILIATGNGPFNGSVNWGDSVLELTPDASRLLHNWTPTNQAQLNASDTDVGSTAPALLPKTSGYRLAVQGGKAGQLYLLDLNRLDGTRGGPGPRLGGELQQIAVPGDDQMFTAPTVWTHAGRTYVFVADDSGTAAYVLGGGHHPRLHVAWQNATAGTSPVLAGGLLYIYDEKDGALTIRQPTSGLSLSSLPVGVGHWNSPIVVGGRIILPEGDANNHSTGGTLDIYHLPGR